MVSPSRSFAHAARATPPDRLAVDKAWDVRRPCARVSVIIVTKIGLSPVAWPWPHPPHSLFLRRHVLTDRAISSHRKQSERAARIAGLSAAYRYPLSKPERDVLDRPIDELVRGVQDGGKASAIDVLRAYGKVAMKAQEKTNCVTEIMMPEAETWIENGSINLAGPLAGVPVSLKDSIHVAGFDTSVGYSCNTGKPQPADGPMTRMLKDAGAVPFVKTALPITLLSFESTNDVWGENARALFSGINC